VLNAVFRRVPNIGPLVEGCITGGIYGFVAVLNTAILTGWLDFSGGGFSPVLEYCPGRGGGGVASRFLKIALCSGNYVCCFNC
jgi:hypothetical protein